MRVSTVTVGVFKGREPWGVHSQESDSLRRQHLPRVTMAGQQQTPPKMPTHEEANTRPQHQSRLPSLQTLHQVGHGQPQAAAPSGSSSQGREAASRPQQLVPSPRVYCGEWDAAGRMQSCRRAPCSPTANTNAAEETNRCLLRDSESSMMLVERTRRDQVWAARSSKAPAPKRVHDPHEHGSTSAAGRVSVPASMGMRHVGLGHQAQAVQEGSKAPVGRYKCILIGKSVRTKRRALGKPEDMTHVAVCSRKEEDLPELEWRQLARSQHPRRGSPAGSPASMASHARGNHWLRAPRAIVPQVPKNHPGALAKLGCWEDISTKELSQEEDIKIHSIWDAAQWDVSEVLHKRPAEQQDSESSMMLVERDKKRSGPGSQ
ncbi:uncharacterized protein LOC121097582 [Falco naumanni]|uniref:uncharacterized protein LOC121097582 n=1 Tax=Falco naumanni TaxID=148594 RepID=UPI001ADE18BC|nr:uncharacterized protein LOC121097582 [Falco naumanni]